MATLKEEALAYEAPKTKNIADLDKVPIDLELEDRQGTTKNTPPKDFSYKVAIIEGEEYRVPGIVLAGIKNILKEYPETKEIRVLKTGEGLKTKYNVINFLKEEKVE